MFLMSTELEKKTIKNNEVTILHIVEFSLNEHIKPAEPTMGNNTTDATKPINPPFNQVFI